MPAPELIAVFPLTVLLFRVSALPLHSWPMPAPLFPELLPLTVDAVSVAVHPTQSEADLRGIFAMSPVRFAFVGDDEQLELADVALDNLELRVILDPAFVRRQGLGAGRPDNERRGHGCAGPADPARLP